MLIAKYRTVLLKIPYPQISEIAPDKKHKKQTIVLTILRVDYRYHFFKIYRDNRAGFKLFAILI